MLDADQLRREAERCFRLARGVNAEDVVGMLEALGRELEEKARALEKTYDWPSGRGLASAAFLPYGGSKAKNRP
jgi:hypothetical protein